MKNVKLGSAVVLSIILVVGALAMSAHAARGGPKGPKEKPVLAYVMVSGDIQGGGDATAGDPKNIAIEFGSIFNGSFVDDDEIAVTFNEAGLHVANPDGDPTALTVGGPGKRKRLEYFYCTADSHSDGDVTDGICNHPQASDGHNPEYYRQLVISNGQFDRKAGITVFPEGSTWAIVKKIINEDGSWSGQRVAQGILGQDVTYQEVYLP